MEVIEINNIPDARQSNYFWCCIGGAFVIPYVIVLFLVGKPVYYLEMLVGQFSSRGSLQVFDFAPIMRGTRKR